MKRPISFMGLTAIATMAVLTTPSHASAANLSQDAKSLLVTSPSDSQYETRYNDLMGSYNDQAANLSLAFDDWFAINSFVNNERAAYGTNGAKLDDLISLDLSDLTWEAGAHDVEVFFINEGAGYRNKFGYATSASDTSSRNGMKTFWNNEVDVIWDDVASSNSILANHNGSLALGEGYTIGDVDAGDTVNFFIRNGGRGNGDVFDALSIDETKNADGLQHVTTYQYGEYLVLAYEDLWGGGDRDYNDVVIAVKGLTDTAAAEVPEPGSALALLGLSAVGTLVRKKRHTNA